MIFLTVGTHEPFDRLVQGVDEWCSSRGTGDQVFGQITKRATYLPKNFEWTEVLVPDEFDARFKQASHIISHAGMGTLLTAFFMGKPIAALPRRGHLNETRNDHQFATFKQLKDRKGAFFAQSEEDLPHVLDRLIKSHNENIERIGHFAEPDLIDAVRKLIHE